MEGWLAKKGRRYGSRVRRYMRLKGSVLSNHRAKDEPATWSVSLQDAKVSSNMKKKKLVLELYDIGLELYADSRDECSRWFDALKSACHHKVADTPRLAGPKSPLALKTPVDRQVKLGNNHQGDRETVEDKEKLIAALNRSFKVVSPKAPALLDDAEDAQYEQMPRAEEENGAQPHTSPAGAIYEESPTSIIFKQFKFPKKK